MIALIGFAFALGLTIGWLIYKHWHDDTEATYHLILKQVKRELGDQYYLLSDFTLMDIERAFMHWERLHA